MRIIILLLITMAVSACSFTPVKPGTVNIHDEFTGMTAVTVGPIQIERGIKWDLSRVTQGVDNIFVLTVVRDGATNSAGSGSKWRFLRNNRMDLIIDGERQSLGNADHDGEARTAGAGGVYTVERLTYQLNGEALKALSSSFDTIKGRIGSLEFNLNPEQIKALNQFADTEITPYLIN